MNARQGWHDSLDDECSGVAFSADMVRRYGIEESRCLFLRHVGIRYSEERDTDKRTTKRMPHILWTRDARKYLDA